MRIQEIQCNALDSLTPEGSTLPPNHHALLFYLQAPAKLGKGKECFRPELRYNYLLGSSKMTLRIGV